jgi:hypothetical protein
MCDLCDLEEICVPLRPKDFVLEPYSSWAGFIRIPHCLDVIEISNYTEDWCLEPTGLVGTPQTRIFFQSRPKWTCYAVLDVKGLKGHKI